MYHPPNLVKEIGQSANMFWDVFSIWLYVLLLLLSVVLSLSCYENTISMKMIRYWWEQLEQVCTQTNLKHKFGGNCVIPQNMKNGLPFVVPITSSWQLSSSSLNCLGSWRPFAMTVMGLPHVTEGDRSPCFRTSKCNISSSCNLYSGHEETRDVAGPYVTLKIIDGLPLLTGW